MAHERIPVKVTGVTNGPWIFSVIDNRVIAAVLLTQHCENCHAQLLVATSPESLNLSRLPSNALTIVDIPKPPSQAVVVIHISFVQ